LADNQIGGSGMQFSRAGSALGILVFLAGIAMIITVFLWGYELFVSMDEEVLGVRYVGGLTAQQSAPGGDVASAEPGGPGLAEIAAVLGFKFIALLVLGWLGAMVAGKGAQMAGVGGKPKSE
jgi:hypothetical protein